jgi:hypothetical protein
MGVFIVALQILATQGELKIIAVSIVLFSGLLLAILELPKFKNFRAKFSKPVSIYEGLGLLMIAIYMAPTFLAPLSPPTKWDELMYHLPHAEQWMLSGKLQINEWLRYAWFPYNFELLYASGMIYQQDVFTHLLHALAGWLTALIVYRTGIQYADRITACLATIIWISLTKDEYDSSNIDMGVSLFIFGSCVTFYLWLEAKNLRWLYVSSFLLGVAIGAKYLNIGYLPLFLVALLIREHRPRVLFSVIVSLIIPCIYWYARNAIMTGDPINPLGGKIFGFTDWNLGDYQYQIEVVNDVKDIYRWPPWHIWVALLVIIFRDLRHQPIIRSGFIFAIYSIIIWRLSSHYSRYLMPVYPVLALLEARFYEVCFHFVLQAKDRYQHKIKKVFVVGANRLAIALLFVLFLAFAKFSLYYSKLNWFRIAATPEARAQFLEKEFAEYKLLDYLKNQNMGRIYQFGFEGLIYYAPKPIWGDHFGPWRYRDRLGLPTQGLASKLRSDGFDILLVKSDIANTLESKKDFDLYFEKILAQQGGNVYRIRE